MQTINKGAPLDVAFVNDLVTTVEKLVTDSNSSQYKRATIKNAIFESTSASTVRTADARIQAETFYGNVISNIDANTPIPFSLALTNFSTTPVITITPILINETASRPAITATITSAIPSRVTGYLLPLGPILANQQISLSLIAIGIPTNVSGTATETTSTSVRSLAMQPPQST